MMILKTSRANLSSNDQLSLDLPFAETKSLTARVGPTPTFTRASSGTFVGSNGLIQTAATNIPRFDHTSAGVCRGLLIEESRTNSLIRSAEMTVSPWSGVGASRNTTTQTAPDGSTSAISLIEDTSTGPHIIFQNIALSSATYAFSVFAKANTRNWIFVDIFNSAASPTSIGAYFNLSNGTIGNIDSGITASITDFGNGWYRCSVLATRAISSAVVRLASANGTNSYTGNGTSGVFAWGAQLEAGSFATSYIPTTTASVVRSADVCSISGAAFNAMWDVSNGTFFISTTRLQQSGQFYGAMMSANDGTNSNRIFIGNEGNPNDIGFNITRLGVVEYGGNIVNGGLVRRAALAYSQTSTNRSYNGINGIDDNNVLIPTVTQMVFGSGQVISSIKYYRRRLSNAKLQALTV